MNNLIKNLRDFLKKEKIDYLLINTCDDFLLEYNENECSARYWVTKFTGSCGEALLSVDELFLFVDGRYHIQADCEVGKDIVTVVKLGLGESLTSAMMEKLRPDSTLAIVASKTSLSTYNLLSSKLTELNIKIKLLDKDPVFNFVTQKINDKPADIQKISLSVAGCKMSDKIRVVRQYLAADECFLFTKLEDIAYLTNLRGYKIPYSSTFKAKLIISKNNCILFSDEIIPDLSRCEVKKLDEFQFTLKEYSEKYKVIFEPASINLECHNLIKHNSIQLSANEGEHVFNLKSIKNKAELEHYVKAYERTDRVVEYISDLVNGEEDFSEFELAEIVEAQYKKQGANALSFKTIMAFGENTALIHYSNSSKERKLKDGDLVLLDCGGYFEGGYATDITRTFVRGNPSELQKKVYTTVLKGFLQGYNHKIGSETTGADIDLKARNVIEAANLEGFSFAHGTGHGVGISVHEGPPYISQSKLGAYKLKQNMVFSIEPGLYKEGWGGVRLENIVFVNKVDSVLKLSSLSKARFEEKLIDYDMLSTKEKNSLKKWQEG